MADQEGDFRFFLDIPVTIDMDWHRLFYKIYDHQIWKPVTSRRHFIWLNYAGTLL